MIRKKDAGKLGAATSSRRNLQTSRHRLHKDEDSAEPQCECASLAGTQRKPKEPARGRVCITRQTRGNISHISHLGEDRHSQCVSEASKGRSPGSWLPSNKRKDQLGDNAWELWPPGDQPCGMCITRDKPGAVGGTPPTTLRGRG